MIDCPNGRLKSRLRSCRRVFKLTWEGPVKISVVVESGYVLAAFNHACRLPFVGTPDIDDLNALLEQ